ncbi:unnamed protein product [Oncorhynchus mykiss]|uniref:Uncharacterized protein n=1 Tax=Oncorhynchus mykiss TaxID=8022 RepID=A0A060W4M3_ONCMY|nr:unnamed protein product [Oncorhynchus mykiss]
MISLCYCHSGYSIPSSHNYEPSSPHQPPLVCEYALVVDVCDCVWSQGGVVLAESQLLMDRQIQQTLLTETAGLSFRAGETARDAPSDLENEPSSPTRLLRNIQRQSAQLSQIVNSLMPPLNLSPSSSPISKDSWRWKGQTKRAFSRRRVNRRRPHFLQVDATCVSARTRPLVTYHKPRLFINTTHRQQVGTIFLTSGPIFIKHLTVGGLI